MSSKATKIKRRDKDRLVTGEAFTAKKWNEAVVTEVELGTYSGLLALRKLGINVTREQAAQIEQLVAEGNISGAQEIILALLTKELGDGQGWGGRDERRTASARAAETRH